MKWMINISILILIVSCQNEKKETKEEKKGKEHIADTSVQNKANDASLNKTNPGEINFKDFPIDWILLTKVDSVDGLRIVSYCDAQTPQFYFTQKGDVSFNINYGQSADNYLVESFDIKSDNDSVMKGTFKLTHPAANNVFSINKPVSFVWYKGEHYAEFRGLRQNVQVEYFCVNDPQPHFGIIKEPCEEI